MIKKPLPTDLPTLDYDIRWIQNYINEKHTLVHLAGFNGVTFCGINHLTINTSNVVSEVTCIDCRAEHTLDKYKTYVKHSDVPIYLHDSAIKAMKEFLSDVLKFKNMNLDPLPASIATNEYIFVYLKDRPNDPIKIRSENVGFNEVDGYTVFFLENNDDYTNILAAPTYNILYLERKIEAKK